jgi:beta-mannosidase
MTPPRPDEGLQGTVVDLGGTWSAAPADDALRRSYADDDLDDSGWEPLWVPGHWQRTPAFADHDGPILHRRRFERPDTAETSSDDRWWLRFEGVFYQSDVWLDGTYLGDTEGYFFPHQFDVTAQLVARTEHTLATEVTCAPQRDLRRKRNLTGAFQHSESIDPRLNPGGIWRAVRLLRSGPVRILHRRVVCTEADADAATLACRLVLDAEVDHDAVVVTRIAGVDHRQRQHVAAGENQIEWTVVVPDPVRWWPHALGDPALHDVDIAVVLEDGRTSDSVRLQVGLRSIAMDEWIVRVNGERLFLKGASQGPSSYWLGESTAEDHERDLRLAKDAGLDLLRVHAHVSTPELYAAADRAGMLVWQDLPLQWGHHRSVRRQAMRQAREAVDLLGHHPSVAIWCGHNSPIATTIDDERLATAAGRRRTAAAVLAGQELPTYNRTILDRSVARTLRRNDPSRPVVPHSGALPSLPTLDGTDSHLYLGWYTDVERRLPALAATMPRLVRFVGEFGAQAVPVDAPFVDPTAWPDLPWRELSERRSAQVSVLDRHIPIRAFERFEDWAAATRQHQADVVRFTVETLRRLKYRPTGGFALFSFADSLPGITFSVLSSDRVPKDAYLALRDVCAPVVVVADRLPDHVHPDEPLAVQVHVVSDLRTDLEAVEVTASWCWEGGESVQRFEGPVPADSCVLAGIAEVDAPEAAGPLQLRLELRYDGRVTTRHDATVVVAGAHVH